MNFADLIPTDVTGDLLVTLVAAIAAFVNVVMIYRVMIERDPVGPRIRAINERMHELKDGISRPRAHRRRRREQSIGFMRQVVRRLNLLKSREAEKVQLKLLRAGYRSRDALNVYFFLKLSLPFALGVIALVLLYVVKLGTFGPNLRMTFALGAVVAGAYMPEIYIRQAVAKRKKALLKALPDALDLLVICAESGLGLDSALVRVSRELGASFPELAEELHLTAVELSLLPERRQALDNLNRRTDLPSIRGVVNTLFQAEKYGTPLAHSLRVLAAEYRNDRMMRAEAKAARLPAILTVPMIVFILPSLFIVLIGPAVLKTMDMLRAHNF